MPEPPHSKVFLEDVALEDFSFKDYPDFIAKGPDIQMTLAIETKIEKLENLRYLTRCALTVNANRADVPFAANAVCRVIAGVKSLDDINSLEEFAQIGAVYNAVVFLRELIRDVTSRTKRGPVLIPLIDINQLR
jgi:preprotein translocase subunit SecB